ncbi:Superfamily I DNA and/or RNA helicase [Pseudidiomarina planktonica]|uniref:Superfamily I DNA and/or RNA helicase n=1 Tax=Pseudidiomarina planktonica TaxID=1323738 RepID=A0A1Y6EEK9_9GAMM|nr:AAA domain-containing protein [Pseudidiomarina planktonica]RUO66256.1 hypothetical protein CWI77_07495 [Pseudidiomarina planktonica]SMQ59340.1 Superfamily I DNA and/or RNA helicase [Pseudidiomarina planktonica]
MATLKKKALSHFLRTNCARRLRLDLYPEDSNIEARDERAAQLTMPPADSGRPALVGLTEAGQAWEEEVFNDLIKVFSDEVLFKVNTKSKFTSCSLLDVLNRSELPRFILEPSFTVSPSFEKTFQLNYLSEQLKKRGEHGLRFSKEFRPDIIELITPNDDVDREAISSNGEIEIASQNLIGLRVIDIKLAASASIPYFGEVAFYSMILAAWLVDNNLSDRFFVSAKAAVWPGKHLGSTLGTKYLEAEKAKVILSSEEATSSLHEDLTVLPKDVYTSRVKEFLEEDLPQVLLEQKWDELPWHVSPACIGCEYLGYKWTKNTKIHEEHCWPKAVDKEELCQVIGLTRGASDVLVKHKIKTIKDLSALSATDKVYDKHYTLTASRSVLAERASALGSLTAKRAPRSSNTLLPKSISVYVLLGVEFDISSGLTLAFSWKAWKLHNGKRESLKSDVYIVEEKKHDTERSILLLWLTKITQFLNEHKTENDELKYQVYLWDETSFAQLKRVISRHLTDILNSPDDLASFSWMFPSEEVLPDPKYANSSRPLSIVKSLIMNSVSADIPFYYNMTLLSQQYYPSFFDAAPSSVFSTMYNDPLSDHIPSERAHDIWSKSERNNFHYKEIEKQVIQTCKNKLNNLDRIILRANEDFPLKARPNGPALKLLEPRNDLPGVSHDGEIWYSFASLNNALQEFETDRVQSLDEYEREARFYSIRLDQRITGADAKKILKEHNLHSKNTMVFKVCARSIHSKIKVNSIGYSILPEKLSSEASYKVIYFLRKLGLDYRNFADKHKSILNKPLRNLFDITVEVFDRDSKYIVVRFRDWGSEIRSKLFSTGTVDFSSITAKNRAIIDPIHINFSLKKIKSSIKAIKNPPLANSKPVLSVPNRIKPRQKRRSITPTVPCESFIWAASSLPTKAKKPNEILKTLDLLEASENSKLNESQRDAVSTIHDKKLGIIWGPPGTGKTSTLARGIATLIHHRNINEEAPLRVLVTANTWVAIDTLCRKLANEVNNFNKDLEIDLYRLFSSQLVTPKHLSEPIRLVATSDEKNPDLRQLLHQLRTKNRHTVVFATPQQVFNIRNKMAGNECSTEPMFDHIIVDEASQLDMASMMMVFPSFAENASLTVVGDDKQMPPIFQAEMPLHCESQLGSIFNFYTGYWNIEKTMLQLNYRSNEEIVAFSRNAGYRKEFRSNNAQSKIALQRTNTPSRQSDNWLEFVVDPEKALVCIVHDDTTSPQRSTVETELTVEIIEALYGSLAPSEKSLAYGHDDFFEHGVGIVTPHVAQKSSIYSSLTKKLSSPSIDKSKIYDAIDTVERFQGQEKDVIIVSYALSDRDSIMQEEEFIFGLERFNVAISRAKHKAIVIISKELVKHIPKEIEVVEASRLIKLYSSNYLRNSKKFSLSDPKYEMNLNIKYSDRS